jgi:integrase
MPRQHNRLTDITLKQAKQGDRLCDGDGLNFTCTAPGRGSWVYRYGRWGKVRYMGLGSYPDVSIAKARSKRDEAHQHRIEGRDPIFARDDHKLDAAKTFRDWSEQFIEERGQDWGDKHKADLKHILEEHAYPWIGTLSIREIDTRKVHKILLPIWYRMNPTAKTLRSVIERIWDFAAVLTKWEGSNPARWRGNLDKLLEAPAKVHTVKSFPSVPYEEITRFYAEERKRKSVSRRTLAFIILTVPRDIMVLPARRKEFDLEKKIWTIPGPRVKGIRDDFRLPLADPAIAILDELNIRNLGPNDFVFPGLKLGSHITNDGILDCLHTIDVRYTVHGFRSSLRTWGSEYKENNFRQDIVEMALAHLTKAAKAAGATSLEVWRAYQRGDALEKRRELMDEWANFVTGRETSRAVAATEPMTFTPSSNYGQIKITLGLQSAHNVVFRASFSTAKRIEGIALPEMSVFSASPKELAVQQNIDGTVEPTDAERAGLSASGQPPSQPSVPTAVSVVDLVGASASGQRVGVQSRATEGDVIAQLDLAEPDQAMAHPLLQSLGNADPIIRRRDRIGGVILAQINDDEYEVRKGRSVVGVVSFFNGQREFGWRLLPRLHGMQASRKLHPNPEACLKGRFSIVSILTLSSF